MSNDKKIPDGFEEFASALNELSPTQKEEFKKNQDNFQSFELYSFLEEEVNRLEKMAKTLSDTAFKLNNYSQDENVLQLKVEENTKAKENFVEKLSDPKSLFWRSVTENFNGSF